MYGLFAMLSAAVFCFGAPNASAATSDSPTFVREVALSKGNWLWHHYVRMSPSYRKAHSFTSFMKTEACFLPDRKCTEADWRRVPRSQKIYIPTENVLLKVAHDAATPVLGLSLRANGKGLYSLYARTAPLAQAEEVALNDRIKNLEFINRDLRHQYGAIVATYQYLVVITALFVCAFLVLTFVMWRIYKRKNEEIADLKDDLEEMCSLGDVPMLTDVIVPAKPFATLPRISAVDESLVTPFPTSIELVFKEFDSVHGTGYAEDEVHSQVYLINRNTRGFHEQLRRDERFLAVTTYPNFVEQILEK